jgi:hypothetical protein
MNTGVCQKIKNNRLAPEKQTATFAFTEQIKSTLALLIVCYSIFDLGYDMPYAYT